MKTIQIFIIAVMATLFTVAPAYALDLQEAKKQGAVGELASGYLGSPQTSPSEKVGQLIAQINAKRKAKYQEVAKSQNLPLATIEKLAGEKAFKKTAKGHYVEIPGIGWKKK